MFKILWRLVSIVCEKFYEDLGDLVNDKRLGLSSVEPTLSLCRPPLKGMANELINGFAIFFSPLVRHVLRLPKE